MKTFAITTLLCLAAAPLAAQTVCPTSADLNRGIRIDFEDGSSEVYRGRSPGLTAVEGFNPDGSGYEMELAQGTHLLMYQYVDNGVVDQSSRIVYDYGLDPAAMPAPAPGGSWQTAVTVYAADGTRNEPQKQVYGAMTPINIAGCEYDMVPVTIAYATSDHYVEGIEYLPALGIGYLIWNEADDIERVPAMPISIAVLTK